MVTRTLAAPYWQQWLITRVPMWCSIVWFAWTVPGRGFVVMAAMFAVIVCITFTAQLERSRGHAEGVRFALEHRA